MRAPVKSAKGLVLSGQIIGCLRLSGRYVEPFVNTLNAGYALESLAHSEEAPVVSWLP